MKRIHIDFETRSTVDIWESGGWIYSTHPTTDILCIAYAVDNGAVTTLPADSVLSKELFAFAKDPEVIFIAHNAFFEQCIWQNIMVKRYGFPEIPFYRWRCTAAKACAMGLPKALNKAVLAFGLSVGKDMAGQQIMKKLAKPRVPKKTEDPNGIYWHSSPEELQKLYEYCAQDVEVERELDKKLPDLLPQEQEVWFLDQIINARGVQTDQAFINKVLEILDVHVQNLNKELVYLTEGKVTKGTQVQGLLSFFKEKGVELTDLTKDTVKRAIAEGTLPKELRRVLRLRQELGKASVAKYTRMVSAADSVGVVRDNFVYHSASTGRWGGKLVQMQNLPRGAGKDTDKYITQIKQFDYNMLRMLHPNDMLDKISSCLRGCFVPRAGHTYLIVDYAAIEARVVMWLAQERLGLEEFRQSDFGNDVDIYVKMARRIYGNNELTKDNKKGRQLGKQAILGAGYGMSGNKFCITCAGYGIEITPYEGERIINLYRQTYSAVRNFWYAMERTAIDAVNHPSKYIPCGYVQWYYNQAWDYLFMILPSGRYLSYAHPKLGQGDFGISLSYMTEVNTQWVRRETYGGHLTENCSQAVARDVMAYVMPGLERAGIKTVMHTHDEIVAEVPKGQEHLLKNMVDIMCKEKDWSKGLPLKAEGFVTDRYRKE